LFLTTDKGLRTTNMERFRSIKVIETGILGIKAWLCMGGIVKRKGRQTKQREVRG
jgi:hypothetical protein